METVINGMGFFATGILLGAMLFFSGVMAPLIFTKLEADVAGRFIRQVFPWYYLTRRHIGQRWRRLPWCSSVLQMRWRWPASPSLASSHGKVSCRASTGRKTPSSQENPPPRSGFHDFIV